MTYRLAASVVVVILATAQWLAAQVSDVNAVADRPATHVAPPDTL